MDDKKQPKMETLPVMSISQMNELLQKSHCSPNSVPSQSSSLVDQQLLEAKSQIENSSITNNDTGVCAPIYRNASMFKSLDFTTIEHLKPEVDLSVEVGVLKGDKKTLESSIAEVKTENSALMEKLGECNGAHVDLTKTNIFCLRERDLLHRFVKEVSEHQALGENKERILPMISLYKIFKYYNRTPSTWRLLWFLKIALSLKYKLAGIGIHIYVNIIFRQGNMFGQWGLCLTYIQQFIVDYAEYFLDGDIRWNSCIWLVDIGNFCKLGKDEYWIVNDYLAWLDQSIMDYWLKSIRRICMSIQQVYMEEGQSFIIVKSKVGLDWKYLMNGVRRIWFKVVKAGMMKVWLKERASAMLISYMDQLTCMEKTASRYLDWIKGLIIAVQISCLNQKYNWIDLKDYLEDDHRVMNQMTFAVKVLIDMQISCMNKSVQSLKIFHQRSSGTGVQVGNQLRRRLAADTTPSQHMEGSMFQQQQQVVPQQESYSQNRAVALQSVESTITELSGIFTNLATMVAHQGELAIRIDDNMEETMSNVEGAREALLKHLNRISSNRWLIIKIFAILIFFLIIFLFFLA